MLVYVQGFKTCSKMSYGLMHRLIARERKDHFEPQAKKNKRLVFLYCM